jgi:hypothetical protein
MTTCPKCQQEMIKGQAAVHASTLATFFVGFFWQRLWFYPDDEKYPVKKVVTSGASAAAWECLKCGAILIEPEADD